MSNTKNILMELASNIDAASVLQDLCGVNEIYENGNELIHSCQLPFGIHKNGDQSPSASLNKETLLYNCFSCGGGSIIWLLENVLDINEKQAVAKLKEYSLGSVLDYEKFIDKLKENLSTSTPVSKLDIPIYSDTILNPWVRRTSYMDSREITHAVQDEMKTGVRECIEEWVRHNDGYQQIIVSRAIIPHFFNGQLVGWQGRKLTEDPRVPKYKNSKNFPKAWTLYNYDNVCKDEEIIVVESPMSVLKLKSLDITNVVSTFGAGVSNYQIHLLRQFQEICVWMDGDDAGRRASSYLTSCLSKTNMVTILEEDGEDPASVGDPLDYLMNQRKNVLQWTLNQKGLKV